MKVDWTRKRTKLEKWQKSALGSIPQIDLDSIRSEFALKRTQLEKSLAELGVEKVVFWDGSDTKKLLPGLRTTVEKVVFWDGSDTSQVDDILLTVDQWNMVSHSVA